MIQESIEDWVINKADGWKNHYEQNYRAKHDEYYRLWRGIWSDKDKTRQSERSRIIAPALQQAVESNVSEIEEATFGRGNWFDIKDDKRDKENLDVQQLRQLLQEDFTKCKIRKSVSECLINAAVYGTGIAEVVLETEKEMIPASQPILEGHLKAVGVNVSERTVVKLKPIMPQNFFYRPCSNFY